MQDLDIGFLRERYELAKDRVGEIVTEAFAEKEYETYFHTVVAFVRQMCEEYEWIEAGNLKTASMEELQARNKALYAEVLPENYEKSFLDPAFAVEKFGEEMGRILCAVYCEMRNMIESAYSQDLEKLVIYAELFIEVYHAFAGQWEENKSLPAAEEIRQIYY